MSQIWQVELQWKENLAMYDDSDSSTDYFHSIRGSLRLITDCIRERGADIISVIVVNDDPRIPAETRVRRIAKSCGYYYQDISENRTWNTVNGTETYKHLEYRLTKPLIPALIKS